MSMSDESSILVFDVETTGTDKQCDQVIELCVQFGLSQDAPQKVWRFLPSAPMSKGAQAVHGISMDELQDAPSFASCADQLREMFAKATMLVGYNLRFDIEMLQAEYWRLNQTLDFSHAYIVDPLRLWQRLEPRSLMDAHKRFVGDSFEAAHSAQADVAATARVLLGMRKNFALEHEAWPAIADICDPNRKRWVAGSHHCLWGEEGKDGAKEVLLGFGKHAGKSLTELAMSFDDTYLKWIVKSDFPQGLQELCKQALRCSTPNFSPEDFRLWAFERYGQKTSEEPKVKKLSLEPLKLEPRKADESQSHKNIEKLPKRPTQKHVSKQQDSVVQQELF